MTSSADALVLVRTGLSTRRVRLADCLDAAGRERAARRANAWIKRVRHARIDGLPFRERFTYRGDSLWWFAELYLHKEQTVLALLQAIEAGTALLGQAPATAIEVVEGGAAARLVLPQLARARSAGCTGAGVPPGRSTTRALALEARSTALMLAAVGSPARPWRAPRPRRARAAAFVHRAFWRGGEDEGGAESYIGPVLTALERQLPAGALVYIGVGPAVNFRARRWWRPSGRPAHIAPVERLVPRSALAGSVGLWAARHAVRRALHASHDLRDLSVIDGCDLWSALADAFAGVALLQFPWSARAMDEAGAALDALHPDVALTYAEAGGWGRALAMEARRRGVPLAGLQHGFIYRHWLNYLHEPDEMAPLGAADAGFPLPDLTLVFDEYAARHLREAGRFPADRIEVTGSPRLDAMAAEMRRLTAQDREQTLAAAGAGGGPMLVLVTKYAEARGILPALLEAVRGLPEVQLAIKAHPGETPDPYRAAAAGIPNVRVLPGTAPLAPLLAACRAVVTVNSTVALDAVALGIPALAVGLPSNLSPFVEAGALAGAGADADIPRVLRALLYDEEFRSQLASRAGSVAEAWRMASDGGAAARSAAAVLRLAARTPLNEER